MKLKNLEKIKNRFNIQFNSLIRQRDRLLKQIEKLEKNPNITSNQLKELEKIKEKLV